MKRIDLLTPALLLIFSTNIVLAGKNDSRPAPTPSRSYSAPAKTYEAPRQQQQQRQEPARQQVQSGPSQAELDRRAQQSADAKAQNAERARQQQQQQQQQTSRQVQAGPNMAERQAQSDRDRARNQAQQQQQQQTSRQVQAGPNQAERQAQSDKDRARNQAQQQQQQQTSRQVQAGPNQAERQAQSDKDRARNQAQQQGSGIPANATVKKHKDGLGETIHTPDGGNIIKRNGVAVSQSRPDGKGGQIDQNLKSGAVTYKDASGKTTFYKNPSTGTVRTYAKDGSVKKEVRLGDQRREVVYKTDTIYLGGGYIQPYRPNYDHYFWQNAMVVGWMLGSSSSNHGGGNVTIINNNGGGYPQQGGGYEQGQQGGTAQQQAQSPKDISFKQDWKKVFPNLEGDAALNGPSARQYKEGKEWIADYVVLNMISEYTPEKPTKTESILNTITFGWAYGDKVKAFNERKPLSLDAAIRMELGNQAIESLEALSQRKAPKMTDYVDSTTGALKVNEATGKPMSLLLPVISGIQTRNLSSDVNCDIGTGDIVQLSGIIPNSANGKAKIVKKSIPSEGCEVGEEITVPNSALQEMQNDFIQTVEEGTQVVSQELAKKK